MMADMVKKVARAMVVEINQLLANEYRRGLDDAANVAKAHKGSAARRRHERGQPLSTFDELDQQEIQAEERGEDIAADIIVQEIQALSKTAPEQTDG